MCYTAVCFRLQFINISFTNQLRIIRGSPIRLTCVKTVNHDILLRNVLLGNPTWLAVDYNRYEKVNDGQLKHRPALSRMCWKWIGSMYRDGNLLGDCKNLDDEQMTEIEVYSMSYARFFECIYLILLQKIIGPILNARSWKAPNKWNMFKSRFWNKSVPNRRCGMVIQL